MPGHSVIATPEWLVEVAASLGIVAGLLTALGVILRSPLGRVVRWVWRRLFGDPVTSWLQRATLAAVAPELDKARAENAEQHAVAQRERSEQMELILGRFEVVDRLAGLHEQRITALENDRR
jgi:Co/Zn/Cd efflux system component